MVTLHFRLCEIGSVHMDIAGPEKLENILERCAAEAGIELGGVIATKDGKVLLSQDLVQDADVIEVFPAISGG